MKERTKLEYARNAKRRFDEAESRSVWAQSKNLKKKEKPEAFSGIRNVLKTNLNSDRAGRSGNIKTAGAV